MERATEEEREGINVLQEELRSRLAILRGAEYLRKKRKKKEYVQTDFYRDPFKFVMGLFNQEKGGQLKATKSEVEEYLRNSYSYSIHIYLEFTILHHKINIKEIIKQSILV